MINKSDLPNVGEVWQGFGDMLFMCIEFHINSCVDRSLLCLYSRAHRGNPWIAELQISKDLWQFYLKEGKVEKIANSWTEYLSFAATHPNQEVREVFSKLVKAQNNKGVSNA